MDNTGVSHSCTCKHDHLHHHGFYNAS